MLSNSIICVPSGCPTRSPYRRYCPPKTFPCNNTMCVHKAWVCDGEDDCGDGSDEAVKLCGEYRFRKKDQVVNKIVSVDQ